MSVGNRESLKGVLCSEVAMHETSRQPAVVYHTFHACVAACQHCLPLPARKEESCYEGKKYWRVWTPFAPCQQCVIVRSPLVLVPGIARVWIARSGIYILCHSVAPFLLLCVLSPIINSNVQYAEYSGTTTISTTIISSLSCPYGLSSGCSYALR